LWVSIDVGDAAGACHTACLLMFNFCRGTACLG